jgi:predicted chitinase
MEELIEYFNTQGITDPRVQANIIAQIQRESGGIPKTESLNYSPERALEIFPKYFKDLEDAKTVLAQGPEAFAHRIYGNRKNLGNESNDPNEAYKYRGRGLIQLTGRGNYEKYGKLLGIDLVNNPELANDPVIAQKIASSYYLNKGKGKDLSDINVVNKLTGFVDKGGESQKRIDLANKIYKDLEPQKEVVQQGIPTLKPQEEVVTETNPLKQGIGAIKNWWETQEYFEKGGPVKNKYDYEAPVDVSVEDVYKNYRMQEAARRSMMQGNDQDRMDDYAYAREQARRPFVNRYPVDSRGQGAYSTAAPMRNQAARMMGFASGGSINTQGQRPMMTNPQTQANGLASLGRGGDSTLVHMQPQEVAGLQQLAQANGTSLTTNPDTGMPEAFKLGNFFRAALPIAAGYFLGPAAGGLMSGTGAAAYGASGALGGSIAAGAATGGTLAAMSGEDILAGTISGGLGGMSGGGLNTAFGGAGVPEALGGASSATSTIPNVVGNSVPYAGGANFSAAANPNLALGSGTSGLDASLGGPAGGFDPYTNQMATPLEKGNLFNRAPNVSFKDQLSTNLGQNEIVKQAGPDGKIFEQQVFKPAGNLQMAKTLGSPLASMGMGGLEESDFYEDVDFNDPRDKYDPYSKLDLSKKTGIDEAMAADTGLRLFGGGGTVGPTSGYAQGGYLNTGGTVGDGMSDSIPATINGDQPAALSDGEFVIPADVVSHLGNGSSSAGAQRLKDMMSRLRKARTGNEEQGKQIAPKKYMPA